MREGKISKGGLNEKPKGERPLRPPAQPKKNFKKLYMDAIKMVEELQEENTRLETELMMLR